MPLHLCLYAQKAAHIRVFRVTFYLLTDTSCTTIDTSHPFLTVGLRAYLKAWPSPCSHSCNIALVGKRVKIRDPLWNLISKGPIYSSLRSSHGTPCSSRPAAVNPRLRIIIVSDAAGNKNGSLFRPGKSCTPGYRKAKGGCFNKATHNACFYVGMSSQAVLEHLMCTRVKARTHILDMSYCLQE